MRKDRAMWKCDVCKKENPDTVLRCQCGFDRTMDYVNFSSVTKLSQWDKTKYEKQYTVAETPVAAVKKTEKPVEPIKSTVQPKVESKLEKPKEIKPTTKVENKPAKPVQQNPQPKPQSKTETKPPVNTGAKAPKNAETKTPVNTGAKPSTNAGTKSSTYTGAKSSVNTGTKPTANPVQNTTKPNQNRTINIVKKSILPKTKLDWIVLLIGAFLALIIFADFQMGREQMIANGYFTSGYFIPILNLELVDFEIVVYITTIFYLLMYKILGAIQYKKKKWLIVLYPIVSMLPVSVFMDAIWGLNRLDSVWGNVEDMMATWFGLQLLIVILALAEDPAKVIARRKQGISLLKIKTHQQAIIFMLGLLLLTCFFDRDKVEYPMLDVQNLYMWICMAIEWFILYAVSTYCQRKRAKVLAWVFLSPQLLIVAIDTWLNVDDTWKILLFIAVWILMSILTMFDPKIEY